jgi:small-conductance mechanosensitive channel
VAHDRRELGVDIAPILAGVGDVIKAPDVSGLVQKISLRATVLRDLEGSVHIIPNGTMGVLTNMTKEWSRCVIDVNVSCKEDVDSVTDVLREVGVELRRRIKRAFDARGIEIPFPQRTVHIEGGRQDVQEDPRRR